jgi:hypothetical protein
VNLPGSSVCLRGRKTLIPPRKSHFLKDLGRKTRYKRAKLPRKTNVPRSFNYLADISVISGNVGEAGTSTRSGKRAEVTGSGKRVQVMGMCGSHGSRGPRPPHGLGEAAAEARWAMRRGRRVGRGGGEVALGGGVAVTSGGGGVALGSGGVALGSGGVVEAAADGYYLDLGCACGGIYGGEGEEFLRL